MGDVIVRKCNACKGEIVISRSESNAIYYDKMYYHKDCFHALATKRSQSNRGKPEKWMAALSHIDTIEAETRKMLDSAWVKDDLNTWLLEHYDIAMVPARFWQIVADLDSGLYKGRSCKPISAMTLLGMWKWGQKRLNGINAKNKTNHKGPSNDSDRITYDLAILISHVGDYIKYISRTKEEYAEIKSRIQNTNKINYDTVCMQSHEKKNDENILDLMDDIF